MQNLSYFNSFLKLLFWCINCNQNHAYLTQLPLKWFIVCRKCMCYFACVCQLTDDHDVSENRVAADGGAVPAVVPELEAALERADARHRSR
jgi:hypothetical protein